MHLDPRPVNPDDLSFQDEARLMAYLREVASEREFGLKKQRDLDFEERRASTSGTAPGSISSVSRQGIRGRVQRMDWYHGLYQLAGEDHVHRWQVASDPDWEKVPFPDVNTGWSTSRCTGTTARFARRNSTAIGTSTSG